MFPTSESGRRSIDESAPLDSPVGDPVSATDSPGEPLAYSLIGDPGPFVIEEASGQLRTSAVLDYESQPQHRHTVTASVRDPSGESDTVALTIDVVDVNEAPLVSGDAVASFEENDTDAVASFTAVDPEGDAVTWRARGIDGDRFEITAGVLRFESPPDYDAPTDSGRDNTYDVIVEATDSDGLAGALPIAVSVTGVNELPEITGPSTPNAANNSTAAVATYVAADPERGAIGWHLSGDDRDFFSIDRGVLRFRRAPSFQMPRDRDADNNYDVVLEATDGIHTARKEVAVTVTKTTSPPPRREGGGGGGGGPPVVVEIDGASFAAADTETVFTAAVSDDARIGSLSWTVTGPDGFTATSNAQRFSFVAPAGGAYTLSVTVDDTARRTLTGRVTLTVFGDITGHQFVNEILWLAEEGITRGCAAHSYCPSNPVTRAQMATFLARALNLEAPRQRAGFGDVDPSSAHAANIEALYAAQITTGCTQDPLAYCPSRPVTRAQMAAFLHRALRSVTGANSS